MRRKCGVCLGLFLVVAVVGRADENAKAPILTVEDVRDGRDAARDTWNELVQLAGEKRWDALVARMGRTDRAAADVLNDLKIWTWWKLEKGHSLVRVYRQGDGQELALVCSAKDFTLGVFGKNVAMRTTFPLCVMMRANSGVPWEAYLFGIPEKDRSFGLGAPVSGLQLQVEARDVVIRKWSDIQLNVRLVNIGKEAIQVAPSLDLFVPENCRIGMLGGKDPQGTELLNRWNAEIGFRRMRPIGGLLEAARETIEPKSLQPGEALTSLLSMYPDADRLELPSGQQDVFLEYDAHLEMHPQIAAREVWMHRVVSNQFQLHFEP